MSDGSITVLYHGMSLTIVHPVSSTNKTDCHNIAEILLKVVFRSEFFFRTTRELRYLFFLSRKTRFFFQNATLGYMTKTLNHIILFSSNKIQIFFFSNIGNQNIFLEKKHTPLSS